MVFGCLVSVGHPLRPAPSLPPEAPSLRLHESGSAFSAQAAPGLFIKTTVPVSGAPAPPYRSTKPTSWRSESPTSSSRRCSTRRCRAPSGGTYIRRGMPIVATWTPPGTRSPSSARSGQPRHLLGLAASGGDGSPSQSGGVRSWRAGSRPTRSRGPHRRVSKPGRRRAPDGRCRNPRRGENSCPPKRRGPIVVGYPPWLVVDWSVYSLS